MALMAVGVGVGGGVEVEVVVAVGRGRNGVAEGGCVRAAGGGLIGLASAVGVSGRGGWDTGNAQPPAAATMRRPHSETNTLDRDLPFARLLLQ
jgi:hypothetical protein